MRSFIDRKTRRFYRDFLASVEEADGLCELKGFTYEGGAIPDYSSPMTRQWYLLRYFPAYLAEYFLIYKELLAQRFLRRPLHVLSIGAGCGIDYWGLHFAVNDDHAAYAEGLQYTGLDLIRWGYWDRLDREDVWLANKDIREWPELDERGYNLVAFPKSISEFPEDVFRHVKAVFRATRFARPRIGLVGFFRETSAEADRARLESIANVMRRTHGYECLDDVGTISEWGHNDGIQTICPEFVYPDKIKPEIGSVLKHCPTFARRGRACHGDCTSIGRDPILRAGYMRWKVLRLQRA